MAVRRWPRLGRSRASTSRSRISLSYRMIGTCRLKEIENNWESELLPATVKLHIRFVVFGSSAWSSETEVSEPAADCGVLDRSPRPSRRELRPAGVDDSRESVYVQLRCNPRCGVFQGSSGLSNRGSGKFRRQVRDGRSQCPGRPCRYAQAKSTHPSLRRFVERWRPERTGAPSDGQPTLSNVVRKAVFRDSVGVKRKKRKAD